LDASRREAVLCRSVFRPSRVQAGEDLQGVPFPVRHSHQRRLCRADVPALRSPAGLHFSASIELKCLVTGGTGFIGRRLVTHLLAVYPAGDITCLVKTTSKSRESEAMASFRAAGIRLIEGDLTNPFVSAVAAPRVDLVFHLAANIDTAATGAELDVNDVGTEHLLAWLGNNCRGARILYASSIAVHDRRGLAHDRPLTETSPFQPRTEYGETKLRGERVLMSEALSRGYSYTILRLATVYGPDPKHGGLFDLF